MPLSEKANLRIRRLSAFRAVAGSSLNLNVRISIAGDADYLYNRVIIQKGVRPRFRLLLV